MISRTMYGQTLEPMVYHVPVLVLCSHHVHVIDALHCYDSMIIAKDLIRGLLQLDPEKRMTIDQYLASPWIMVRFHPAPSCAPLLLSYHVVTIIRM